jgi:hypothetical protein
MSENRVLSRLGAVVRRLLQVLTAVVPRRRPAANSSLGSSGEGVTGTEGWDEDDEDELFLRMVLGAEWMWHC